MFLLRCCKTFDNLVGMQRIMIMIKVCNRSLKTLRFTTKGAFGDNGSLDVDEDDDEDWHFLTSLKKPCFFLVTHRQAFH